MESGLNLAPSPNESVKRCVNIDWLEVYCLEPADRFPLDAAFYTIHGVNVESREYGTRVYGEMFTIMDEKGYPFLEVRRKPLSDTSKDGGLFAPESCHIRLSNYACYRQDPIGDLRRFLVEWGYTLVKIFRIDICLDFTTFDKGDDPARFMRRYISGKYSKLNQSNVSAHGKDTWERRIWNSVSWGAKKSMISTKFYCKSLELSEVHDKPYIKYAWFLAGLVDDPINCTKRTPNGEIMKPDVWRVEFSIKASAKKWYLIDDATTKKSHTIFVRHTLDCYDSRERLLLAFASLAHHYFHFKVYEEGVRKDRCRDKVLFQFQPIDEIYRLAGNVAVKKSTSKEERLIKLLQDFKYREPVPSVKQAYEVLISHLQNKCFKGFCGVSFSASDILAMQRVISERVGGKIAQDVAQEVKDMTEAINGFEGNFF